MEDGENVSVFSPISLGIKIQTLSQNPAFTVQKPEAFNPRRERVVGRASVSRRLINLASDVAVERGNDDKLDARDLNGYMGIAGPSGKHDRLNSSIQYFGQARYMSLANTERKFD